MFKIVFYESNTLQQIIHKFHILIVINWPCMLPIYYYLFTTIYTIY